MNLLELQRGCIHWDSLSVIGRRAESCGAVYDVLAMANVKTEEGTKTELYLMEAAWETTKYRKSKTRRQYIKQSMAQETPETTCMYCRSIEIDGKAIAVMGAQTQPMKYPNAQRMACQLFCAMLRMGWQPTKRMQTVDWNSSCLIVLELEQQSSLPVIEKDTKISFVHCPPPRTHVMQKRFTLHIGKEKSFSFTTSNGEKVSCCITASRLLSEKVRQEENKSQREMQQIAQIQALLPPEQDYLLLEYECSKPVTLQIFTKDYLDQPLQERGEGVILRNMPEQAIGPHGFPLYGDAVECIKQPERTKLAMEVVAYYEPVTAWTAQAKAEAEKPPVEAKTEENLQKKYNLYLPDIKQEW